MDTLLKAIAGVLIALVLCQILNLKDKNFSVLLVIAVCCIVVTAAGSYIEQIVDFIHTIEGIGDLNAEFLQIILKATGVCLLSEVAMLVCTDAGNAALGKVLQVISSVLILWICIPVFSELLTLVQEILEAV